MPFWKSNKKKYGIDNNGIRMDTVSCNRQVKRILTNQNRYITYLTWCSLNLHEWWFVVADQKNHWHDFGECCCTLYFRQHYRSTVICIYYGTLRTGFCVIWVPVWVKTARFNCKHCTSCLLPHVAIQSTHVINQHPGPATKMSIIDFWAGNFEH